MLEASSPFICMGGVLVYQSLALMIMLVVVGCQQPNISRTHEVWNDANAPLRMKAEYQTNLAKLPLSASLRTRPWSDSYWPSYKGGIAYRWLAEEYGFGYTPPTLEELKSMTPVAIARLSPAEKYDIFRGRFDYPMVTLERMRTNPSKESWEGICHGWAVAAYNYHEPKPVVIKSKDKIEIPFGATDVKALLSYVDGEWSTEPDVFLGARCNRDLAKTPSAGRSAECKDVNAGSFHIVLANQIGILGKSFVADVTRDLQVWNHPVHGFESKVVGERKPKGGEAPGTVIVKTVETKMSYRIEVEPSWDNPGRDDVVAVKEYSYELELDQAGNIVGGEWISDDRPDFLWSKSPAKLEGPFADIGTIYKRSIRGPAATLPE